MTKERAWEMTMDELRVKALYVCGVPVQTARKVVDQNPPKEEETIREYLERAKILAKSIVRCAEKTSPTKPPSES
jgi:hypothetical protein